MHPYYIPLPWRGLSAVELNVRGSSPQNRGRQQQEVEELQQRWINGHWLGTEDKWLPAPEVKGQLCVYF